MTWTSTFGRWLATPHRLVELLLQAWFREARLVADPERSLGWLCGIATA